MAEFRKASADFKGAFEEEMREMERQTFRRSARRPRSSRRFRRVDRANPARSPRHLRASRGGITGDLAGGGIRGARFRRTLGTDTETASAVESLETSKDTRQSA